MRALPPVPARRYAAPSLLAAESVDELRRAMRARARVAVITARYMHTLCLL